MVDSKNNEKFDLRVKGLEIFMQLQKNHKITLTFVFMLIQFAVFFNSLISGLGKSFSTKEETT